MAWVAYVLVIALCLLLMFFIYKYLSMLQKYLGVRKELNNQSLDYHLKKIVELGYDFTLKAGRSSVGRKSKDKSVDNSSKSGKRSKSKSFTDLIDE